MLKRYSCGCFSDLNTINPRNAVPVSYPCFKHKRKRKEVRTFRLRKRTLVLSIITSKVKTGADISIVLGRHDYRAKIYSLSDNGFRWLKERNPDFPKTELNVDNTKVDAFVLEIREAGLKCLVL